jgi:hypothetical protein
MAAVYPIRILAGRGRVTCAGRTANLTERGVYALFRFGRELSAAGSITVELVLPAHTTSESARDDTRTVRYRCRVTRQELMGQHLGVGLEFVAKLR